MNGAQCHGFLPLPPQSHSVSVKKKASSKRGIVKRYPKDRPLFDKERIADIIQRMETLNVLEIENLRGLLTVRPRIVTRGRYLQLYFNFGG